MAYCFAMVVVHIDEIEKNCAPWLRERELVDESFATWNIGGQR